MPLQTEDIGAAYFEVQGDRLVVRHAYIGFATPGHRRGEMIAADGGAVRDRAALDAAQADADRAGALGAEVEGEVAAGRQGRRPAAEDVEVAFGLGAQRAQPPLGPPSPGLAPGGEHLRKAWVFMRVGRAVVGHGQFVAQGDEMFGT